MMIFIVFCSTHISSPRKNEIEKKKKLSGVKVSRRRGRRGGGGGSARIVSASGFNKNPFTRNLGSWKKNRCIPSVQNPPFFPVPALSQIRHAGYRGKETFEKPRKESRLEAWNGMVLAWSTTSSSLLFFFFFLFFLFPVPRFLFDSLPRGYRLDSTRGTFATTTLLHFRVRLIGSRSPAGNVRISRPGEKRGGGGRVGKDGCQP